MITALDLQYEKYVYEKYVCEKYVCEKYDLWEVEEENESMNDCEQSVCRLNVVPNADL